MMTYVPRWAKKKLPGQVKKKVEEWKFASGALVMCLVAYSDGHDVQTLQYVTNIYISFSDMAYQIPALKALQRLGLPSLILVVTGGMGPMNISRNGQ
jgi:hypothetical protein